MVSLSQSINCYNFRVSDRSITSPNCVFRRRRRMFSGRKITIISTNNLRLIALSTYESIVIHLESIMNLIESITVRLFEPLSVWCVCARELDSARTMYIVCIQFAIDNLITQWKKKYIMTLVWISCVLLLLLWWGEIMSMTSF